MHPPQFSVIIPTFNRASLLPTAIRSVLEQTEGDFELIVVDDGSDDDTEAVVAAIDDPRITYHPQARGGVSAARNAGAAISRGEFLVFVDSDDELLPSALERFRDGAETNGWGVVFSGWIEVSPDRREWRTRMPEATPAEPQYVGVFLPGVFAISRRIFTAVGGYDERLRFAENTELGWRVRNLARDEGFTMGLVAEPLEVRYAQPDRSYDLAKYESARAILGDRALLDSPASGPTSPKRRRSTYYAIAGTSAARLGKRREALELTAASIRTDPTSWARYRNLAGVVRSCLRRPPRGAPAGRARVVEDRSAHSPSEHQPGGMHGVVITFNRPESLSRVIDNLAGAGLTSLTIVDNAPSEASRAVAVAAATRLAVTYVPMEENSGPAGGIAEGMGRVLAGAASDDDWIVLLDDDGIPGPPGTIGVLRDFGEWLIARGAPVGAVGLAGAMFDARRGQLVRPSDEELSGPITVSYVAGNQLPTIRVASARKIGVFDADLFFGFDDLDYCLRLGRGGYGVYASGPVWLAHRRNVGRIGPAVGPPPRRENAWRRYYAVRNHIVIMRRYTTWSRALAVTAGHLFWRPISDLLRRRPGVRGLVRAGTRGCVDAWANRLGRRVEPTPGS